MESSYRSFVWVVKVYFNDDFELAPTSFADFVRRLHNNAVLIGVTFV
jgi:hypothetical protein